MRVHEVEGKRRKKRRKKRKEEDGCMRELNGCLDEICVMTPHG